MSWPITIIIRHPREMPKKCTVYPLKGHELLQFFGYPPRNLPDLDDYVRLCEDGPPLGPDDADKGILLLDASWRRVRPMVADFGHVPPRSLPGWQTAFPRVSKLGTDPESGLASVEALYLAHHILDRPTDGFLDHYLWAEEFLELNSLQSEGGRE